jgi:hypothetical protein
MKKGKRNQKQNDESETPPVAYPEIESRPILDHTQIRAQISGAERQNMAQTVAKENGGEYAKTIANGCICQW